MVTKPIDLIGLGMCMKCPTGGAALPRLPHWAHMVDSLEGQLCELPRELF